MSSTKIRHEGIVKSVEGNVVQVEFVQRSACAHCEAKGHCNASESKEKIVEVECAEASRYAVGDNVVVVASQKVGFLAVFYGAVLPTIVIMAAICLAIAATKDEMLAAFLGLGALAAYFVCLYFVRDKLKEKLKFEIC